MIFAEIRGISALNFTGISNKSREIMRRGENGFRLPEIVLTVEFRKPALNCQWTRHSEELRDCCAEKFEHDSERKNDVSLSRMYGA